MSRTPACSCVVHHRAVSGTPLGSGGSAMDVTPLPPHHTHPCLPPPPLCWAGFTGFSMASSGATTGGLFGSTASAPAAAGGAGDKEEGEGGGEGEDGEGGGLFGGAADPPPVVSLAEVPKRTGEEDENTLWAGRSRGVLVAVGGMGELAGNHLHGACFLQLLMCCGLGVCGTNVSMTHCWLQSRSSLCHGAAAHWLCMAPMLTPLHPHPPPGPPPCSGRHPV